MNIVHVNEYEIQKEFLERAEVPRRPKVIISTSLCCLKPLFIKTCRMGKTIVEIREKKKPPKGIPVKDLWALDKVWMRLPHTKTMSF